MYEDVEEAAPVGTSDDTVFLAPEVAMASVEALMGQNKHSDFSNIFHSNVSGELFDTFASIFSQYHCDYFHDLLQLAHTHTYIYVICIYIQLHTHNWNILDSIFFKHSFVNQHFHRYVTRYNHAITAVMLMPIYNYIYTIIYIYIYFTFI